MVKSEHGHTKYAVKIHIIYWERGCFFIKLTFEEIREKEVINITDGSSFGLVDDVLFETETREATGIIIRNRTNFFGKEEEIFIGWDEINTFGKDIILVKTEQKGKLHKRGENILQKLLKFFLY